MVQETPKSRHRRARPSGSTSQTLLSRKSDILGGRFQYIIRTYIPYTEIGSTVGHAWFARGSSGCGLLCRTGRDLQSIPSEPQQVSGRQVNNKIPNPASPSKHVAREIYLCPSQIRGSNGHRALGPELSCMRKLHAWVCTAGSSWSSQTGGVDASLALAPSTFGHCIIELGSLTNAKDLQEKALSCKGVLRHQAPGGGWRHHHCAGTPRFAWKCNAWHACI